VFVSCKCLCILFSCYDLIFTHRVIVLRYLCKHVRLSCVFYNKLTSLIYLLMSATHEVLTSFTFTCGLPVLRAGNCEMVWRSGESETSTVSDTIMSPFYPQPYPANVVCRSTSVLIGNFAQKSVTKITGFVSNGTLVA